MFDWEPDYVRYQRVLPRSIATNFLLIFPQQISTAHGKFLLSSLSFLNFILFSKSIVMKNQNLQPLLALIALSTVQSSAQIFSHNAILFIDTSDNAWYNQVHWPYLSIIASNVTNTKSVKSNISACPWSIIMENFG